MLPGIIFLTGLIFGSFANVVIYRLPRSESIAFPPSRCPACGNKIQPYDNIPLFSYLVLRGRCRECDGKIPLTYPAVELATAILFTGMYLRFGLDTQLLAFLLLGFLLVVISVVDIQRQIIPNTLTLLLVFAGLTAALVNGTFASSMLWASGAFLLFLGLALLKPGAIGMGDVKLSFALGLFFKELVVVAMFMAFLSGSVASILLILFFRKDRKSRVSFAPFIAIGSITAIFAGEKIINWYLGFFPA